MIIRTGSSAGAIQSGDAKGAYQGNFPCSDHDVRDSSVEAVGQTPSAVRHAVECELTTAVFTGKAVVEKCGHKLRPARRRGEMSPQNDGIVTRHAVQYCTVMSFDHGLGKFFYRD